MHFVFEIMILFDYYNDLILFRHSVVIDRVQSRVHLYKICS